MLPESAFRLKISPRLCDIIDKVTNIAVTSYRHLMAVLLNALPRVGSLVCFYNNCFN